MDPLDPEIVAMLICPVTGQSLRVATASELTQINLQIRSRTLEAVSGKVVTDEMDAALLRDDETIAYPVRDAIMILTADEGVFLAGRKA